MHLALRLHAPAAAATGRQRGGRWSGAGQKETMKQEAQQNPPESVSASSFLIWAIRALISSLLACRGE